MAVGNGSGPGGGQGSGGNQTTGGGRSSAPRSQATSAAHSKGVKQGAGAAGLGLAGAVIAAASGGSVVAVAESTMSIATAMAQAAGVTLPPAFIVAFLYKQSTGKPSKLEICAQDWADAAKELNQAAQEIRQLVQAIPGEAWTMDDRPLYESQVEDYGQQLETLATYCSAVQISIMVVAWALFTYSVFAMGMAVYLDALAIVAAAAIAASATVVGAPAGVSLLAECMALAGTALTITGVATGILGAAGTGAAATMGGGALLTANSQENNGAKNAFGAFQKAVATGAAGSLANIAQNGANTGLNFVNKAGKGMIPAAELDLDADRSIDKTWNVGGGAKLTTPGGMGEVEAGYHAKVRDGHVQGQEAELKAKLTTPGGFASASGGGKLEWDEHEDLSNKSFNAGAESGPLGSKAEYEGSFDDKNNYSDKYNVNTPVFNRTDGSFNKKPDDETPPWDKNL